MSDLIGDLSAEDVASLLEYSNGQAEIITRLNLRVDELEQENAKLRGDFKSAEEALLDMAKELFDAEMGRDELAYELSHTLEIMSSMIPLTVCDKTLKEQCEKVIKTQKAIASKHSK